MQKRLRPRMDLNFQSSDPKSDTLSIRPRRRLQATTKTKFTNHDHE